MTMMTTLSATLVQLSAIGTWFVTGLIATALLVLRWLVIEILGGDSRRR